MPLPLPVPTVGSDPCRLSSLPAPFTIEVTESDVALGQPGTFNLPVRIDRHGFDQPLTIRVCDLPPGVTASAVEIASETTAAVVTFEASAQAAQPTPRTAMIVVGFETIRVGASISLLVRGKPGTLDTSFAVSGARSVAFRSGNTDLFHCAVQPGNKVVVAGRSAVLSPGDDTWALARFNEDGSLDSSFGNNGVVITPGVGTWSAGIWGLDLQADGKIVAGGWGNGTLDYTPDAARYLLNGDLDPTFASGGLYHPDIGGGFSALRYLPGDRLLGAGYSSSGPMFIELDGSGSPDPAFGNLGIVHLDVGRGAALFDADPQPEGSIYFAGMLPIGGFVGRLTADGTLDPGFAERGWRTVSTVLYGLTVQDDGRPIAAGGANVLRFLPNGELDPSFASHGIATMTTSASAYFDIRDVGMQPGKKILVFGGPGFQVERLLPDGELDPSFGTGGRSWIPTEGSWSLGLDLFVTDDGRAYLVGDDGENGRIARIWL